MIMRRIVYWIWPIAFLSLVILLLWMLLHGELRTV